MGVMSRDGITLVKLVLESKWFSLTLRGIGSWIKQLIKFSHIRDHG